MKTDNKPSVAPLSLIAVHESVGYLRLCDKIATGLFKGHEAIDSRISGSERVRVLSKFSCARQALIDLPTAHVQREQQL